AAETARVGQRALQALAETASLPSLQILTVATAEPTGLGAWAPGFARAHPQMERVTLLCKQPRGPHPPWELSLVGGGGELGTLRATALEPSAGLGALRRALECLVPCRVRATELVSAQGAMLKDANRAQAALERITE